MQDSSGHQLISYEGECIKIDSSNMLIIKVKKYKKTSIPITLDAEGNYRHSLSEIDDNDIEKIEEAVKIKKPFRFHVSGKILYFFGWV